MWTVQDAKARFSEILRKAREGHPQVIGAADQCVVISLEEYEALSNKWHCGHWLLQNAPGDLDVNLELPARSSAREISFAEDHQ